MRKKKATLNSSVNLLSFIFMLFPSFYSRRLFLNELGEEVLGLHYLCQNIIGMLSLAELGIGMAIMYALYGPLSKGEEGKISAIMNFYGKAYRTIGSVIFILGLILIPAVPLFIKGEAPPVSTSAVMLFFLTNTFITYLFSYKITLIEADQNSYISATIHFCCRVVTVGLQIALLKVLPNYYLFLAIQLLIDTTYFIILNRVINKRYPWISKNEELPKEEKAELITNIKAVCLHKIGGFFVMGTDNLLISALIGLRTVGLFNNYRMIISMIEFMFYKFFAGMNASVGNLIATSSEDEIFLVYKRIYFLNFVVSTVTVATLYTSLEPFIELWIGDTYILDKTTFYLILFNLYFMMMRRSVELLKEAKGLYKPDRFAPIVEATINLVSSLFFAHHFGLSGILMGTVASNILVIFWIKPLIVYRQILLKPLKGYFITYSCYLAICVGTSYISSIISEELFQESSYIGLIGRVAITSLTVFTVITIIFFKNNDFIYFKDMLLSTISSLQSRMKGDHK